MFIITSVLFCFVLSPAFHKMAACFPWSEPACSHTRHKLPSAHCHLPSTGAESPLPFIISATRTFFIEKKKICLSPWEFPEQETSESCVRVHTVSLFHRLTGYVCIKEPAFPCMVKPHFLTWPASLWRKDVIPVLDSKCHEGRTMSVVWFTIDL